MKNRENLERARDEMHLAWLAKTENGVSSGQIGKQYGIRPSNVRTVLGRIRKDCPELTAARELVQAGAVTEAQCRRVSVTL